MASVLAFVEMTEPSDWVLPALLVAVWAALWAVTRRVPWWFYTAGALGSLLIGCLAGAAHDPPGNCRGLWECASRTSDAWWHLYWNVILAVGTMLVLGVAHLLVGMVRSVLPERPE